MLQARKEKLFKEQLEVRLAKNRKNFGTQFEMCLVD